VQVAVMLIAAAVAVIAIHRGWRALRLAAGRPNELA
jgi:hypothetical protein